MEKKDEAKTAWLDSQKMPTKRYYGDWFAKFQEFTGLTGDEILAAHARDKAGTWESKVLGFKNWLLSEKKLSEYSATAHAMAVRGFFSYHRVSLQFRSMESKRISEKSRLTEDYRFSLADLKKLYEVADLEERYVVTAGKNFGLRAGDFLALKRGDLEPYISHELPASIGEIKTTKEKIPAYPFIDTDAQPVIELMLEKMRRDGKTKPNERITSFRKEIQLTRILQRLVARAGIEVGNKRVRFHCLRKFLSDHLASHMAESKWKQIVGKKISEGAYISPDELRKDYARAMPEMTFAKATELEERVKDLEKFTATLTPEQLEQSRRLGILKRKKVSKPEEIEKCEDSEHCQKIVSEENLAGFLSQNWKVVATLPSGKIVIES